VLAKHHGLEGASGAGRSSFDSAALRSGRAEVAGNAAGGHSYIDSAALRPAPIEMRSDEAAAPLAPQRGERVGVRGDSTLHQSFTVSHPRDEVWAFFGRLDEVTSCVPGASVTGTPAPEHVEAVLRVKLGPIVAEFNGTAKVVRDASSHSGIINATARDVRSSSSTRGTIRYALRDENGGAATRVDVDVDYTLTGPLAQFGRSGLVQDIARRMTAAFAQNLEARLNAPGTPAGGGRSNTARSSELKAGSLLASAVWARIKAFFRRK